jgi:AAA15 family ATPase/GTPase
MITKFELENFKSFSNKQELDFSPITLIYGPNSSGKSSIIQSLMMLKQTALSKNKNAELVPSGDDINLGNFGSLVHGQDLSNKMSFSIAYSANHDVSEYRYRHSYPMLFGNSDIRKVDLTYGSLHNRNFLEKFAFSCSDKSNERVKFQFENPIESSEGITYRMPNPESLRKELSRRLKLAPSDAKGWRSLDEALANQFKMSQTLNLPAMANEPSNVLSQYTGKVMDDLKYVFDNLKYLGPLRSSPKKFYSTQINNLQKGLGKRNLGVAIQQGGSPLKERINEFLADFNIPYKIDSKDLGDINTGPLISLQLTDLRNGVTITPKDVGFGIGQVLPIILEAVTSEGNHICVEQPEIHLHPKLQANLADLFIDSVNRGKNQWIVETHSEALMLRVQRRVREGVIPKDFVSVLYVDVGEKGAQITKLKLDDEGDFTSHWPNGFFEERLNERFGGQ